MLSKKFNDIQGKYFKTILERKYIIAAPFRQKSKERRAESSQPVTAEDDLGEKKTLETFKIFKKNLIKTRKRQKKKKKKASNRFSLFSA